MKRLSCGPQTEQEWVAFMRVLICGGGVIGASIAYFLSCRGVAATVIERTGLACAASGKAGGFLALDWCAGTPLAPLARRSFDLHARLAEEIGTDWGYRRLATYGGSAGFGLRGRANAIDWVGAGVSVDQQLGLHRDNGPGPPRKVHRRDDAGRAGAGSRSASRASVRHRAP
jgi:FAD dependent oxidoreductase